MLTEADLAAVKSIWSILDNAGNTGPDEPMEAVPPLPKRYDNNPEEWEGDFVDEDEANEAYLAFMGKCDMPRITHADAYARLMRCWKRRGYLNHPLFESLPETLPASERP